MNRIYISWKDFGSMIEKLSNLIKKSRYKFDGVYGIPRGGLSLAVALSHKLNLPLLLYPTKKSLVVDDISDTGKTLQSHKNKKIACLFSSRWTDVEPDYFINTKINTKDWIVFPWENN